MNLLPTEDTPQTGGALGRPGPVSEGNDGRLRGARGDRAAHGRPVRSASVSGDCGQGPADTADSETPPLSSAGERHVLVIGEGDLAEETVRALEARGARVSRIGHPDQDDVRDALEAGDVDSVAVIAGEGPDRAAFGA